MDPPPPPPQQTPASATTAAVSCTSTPTTNSIPPHISASNTAAAAAAAAAVSTYPDSTDSTPRSRTTDSYFNDPPLLSSKLRLMCSYGGHIVPRPHDKSLCYVGGDTRIVVVDRHTTLSSLSSRLANTLLNGRAFTLKYQLPSEDLDSLISVTTDEDLENMIDEYDRTNSNAANSGKPSRLRLFLFPLKPDSSQSIGPILESNAKSEDWFLNALNGAAGLLNRGFSDSASVNCLLGLDDDSLNGNTNLDLVGGGVRDVEALQKNVKQGQDVHSVPDSPMLENSSSFGSTSSSPSLANLPPIRVHVEDGSVGAGGIRGVLQDQKVVGIEEQFAQINVSGGGGGVGQKKDDCFMPISSPPPMPVSIAISGVPVGPPMMVGDYHNRIYSDDERSDHGVPLGYRKPSLPQSQPPQTQQKSSSGGEAQLPSPDSVSSDNSVSNAINRQKPMIYQNQVMHIPAGVSRGASNPVDTKMNVSDPNPQIQIQQQVQDSGYVLQPQFEQQQQPQQPQQFIHAGTHYIQHHPGGAVPMPAYYSVYPPQQQHHHQLDQQYPVYYVQTRQPQAYNLPMQQSSMNEPTATVPCNPQTQPNPTMAPPQATYNPMRNAPMAKPEMANSGMYRTANAGTPQLVQVSSNQHQQQYVGYSQVHHPSQSGSPVSGVPANYGYEFADPAHAQIYYTQPIAPTIPSHYQTMTAGGAVVLPESSQLPNDSIKQQNRTSQPI
ncbi:RAF-like serine/threonine-protein kinase PRAF [Euphorbia lathyris]|uniref:RAF-like serine/threonine-protein kinase PRAF n=1 Tax=Euphorbia lathyris TaxID=212925 RepID=UPI003313317B